MESKTNKSKIMTEKDSWPIDGNRHHDVSRKALYSNAKINRFLDSESKTLLVAAKGMGKTLLLRVKKNMLEECSEGTTIIPRNAEHDEPELHGTLPEKGIDDIEFWEDLWRSSIILSILTHFSEFIEVNEHDTIKWHISRLEIDETFKNGFLDDLYTNTEYNPSYYLAEILTRSVSSIRRFLRSAHIIDSLSNKIITHSSIVFIDGFDQTLTRQFSDNLEIWKNAQLGLAKTVHRLNTQNRHIKVYASIRQEAYAGFKDDDREVIKGMSIVLEYSLRELKRILEYSIKKYTRHKTIEEFFRVSSIKNGWCGIQENVFFYIYRHLAATPRSVVYCGSLINDAGLEEYEIDEVEGVIRKIINVAGAENLYNDYLIGQKKIFLHSLDDENKIKLLFSLIPSNILHGRALKAINKQFSLLCKHEEKKSHPFCELYNIGLLGTIRKTHFDEMVQSFRKPYEFSWLEKEMIKDDSIYVVHPSLHTLICEERGDQKYFLNPINVIGDERSWEINDKNEIFPTLFISHSSTDNEFIEKNLPLFESIINLYIPTCFWYDKWSIRTGKDIYQEVEKGVEGSDFVLLFVSEKSLASGWVEQEWRKKHLDEIQDKNIRVIAIIIDGTQPKDLPAFLRDKKAVFLNGNKNSISYTFHKISSDISSYYIERTGPACTR